MSYREQNLTGSATSQPGADGVSAFTKVGGKEFQGQVRGARIRNEREKRGDGVGNRDLLHGDTALRWG